MNEAVKLNWFFSNMCTSVFTVSPSRLVVPHTLSDNSLKEVGRFVKAFEQTGITEAQRFLDVREIVFVVSHVDYSYVDKHTEDGIVGGINLFLYITLEVTAKPLGVLGRDLWDISQRMWQQYSLTTRQLYMSFLPGHYVFVGQIMMRYFNTTLVGAALRRDVPIAWVANVPKAKKKQHMFTVLMEPVFYIAPHELRNLVRMYPQFLPEE